MLKSSAILPLLLTLAALVTPVVYAQDGLDEEGVEAELDETEEPVANPDDDLDMTSGSDVDDEPEKPIVAPNTVSPQPAPLPSTPYRHQSTQDGKVFDWKKYENATEVPHPMAEKGLIRITKDKTYVYKVEESAQARAASFRIGMFNPVNLENPDSKGQKGATFEENYDQSDNPAVMFDYEWQLWNLGLGKLGLRIGSGIYIAQGNGHFANGSDDTPREIFTFWAMPNSIGAVYRLQVWDKQLLVPYGEGGGVAFAFGEFRDDDNPPKWGGALGAYFAGGIALNLTYFDAIAAIALDREYGINRVYLTAEYRSIVGLSSNYDFTSDLINGGFLMEF